MKRILSISVLLIAYLATFAQGHFKEIEKSFKEPETKSVLVVSHRADWRNAPENSLQGLSRTASIWV